MTGGLSGKSVDPSLLRRAGDLGVGDWIYTRHQHRDEWAHDRVVEAEPRQQPCARVDFESGRTVVVSRSHRFLLAPAAEVHHPAAYDPAPMNGCIHISEHIAGVALLDAPVCNSGSAWPG